MGWLPRHAGVVLSRQLQLLLRQFALEGAGFLLCRPRLLLAAEGDAQLSLGQGADALPAQRQGETAI
jgi:hypothetical protein